MQIKLKMDRDEVRALMAVARWAMDDLGEPRDLLTFERWDALRELLMDWMRKMPELKSVNSVTLKDAVVMTLVEVVRPEMLPPYEGMVIYGVFAEADRQCMTKMTMLKSNMAPERVPDVLRIGGGER